MISIDLLDENSWNPNEMPEEEQLALLNFIKTEGFQGSIVVWPKGKRYLIIDGAHRKRIAVKAGLKKISCDIAEYASEAEARAATIRYNKHRGHFNKKKLADNIVFLQQHYSDQQMQQMFNFQKDELADLIKIGSMPIEEIEKKVFEKRRIEEEQAPVILDFCVSKQEEKIINRALNAAHFENKSKALAKLCECYLNRIEKGKALAKIAEESV